MMDAQDLIDEIIKLIAPPEADLDMIIAHATNEEVLEFLRSAIEPPTGVAAEAPDNGFRHAPAHMTSGREKIDEMRDMCWDRAGPGLIGGDFLFAAVCASHAWKYTDRDKGDPAGDLEKRRFWLAMEKCAGGNGPDPREGREDFQPWTYKGEG